MSSSNRNSSGGGNLDTHHLIALHEPPAALTELRKELAFHSDITDYAQYGTNFEDCLGRIALKLDIALDGSYEVGPLCEVLVEALRSRRFFGAQPHLRSKHLIDVELVETETGLELKERDRNVTTIIPEDAIVVTETSTKSGSIILEPLGGDSNPPGVHQGTVEPVREGSGSSS